MISFLLLYKSDNRCLRNSRAICLRRIDNYGDDNVDDDNEDDNDDDDDNEDDNEDDDDDNDDERTISYHLSRASIFVSKIR